MNHKGKIYGLVGVIGSGKSYRAEFLRAKADSENRPIIIGDFSEGIRQTLMNTFTGRDRGIQLDGTVYAKWKELKQNIMLPTSGNSIVPDFSFVSGREMFQNTGEYLKKIAGEDIWARWTVNDITNRLSKMTIEESAACDVVFGSLRFPIEAQAIFRFSASCGKEVEIIFCDYHSDSYEINSHVSEKFAQTFLSLGCKDGENITELVKKELRYEKI